METRDYQRLERLDKKGFNPTISTLYALADAFEVDVGELTKLPSAEEIEALEEPLEPRVDRQKK